MSKRVPNEERRVSTTFAVSQSSLRLIDTMGEYMGLSRSGVVNSAIEFYYRWFLMTSRTEVSEAKSDIIPLRDLMRRIYDDR